MYDQNDFESLEELGKDYSDCQAECNEEYYRCFNKLEEAYSKDKTKENEVN